MNAPGVYTTKKKNGDIYYRVSITYRMKHISLGSNSDYTTAAKMYQEARELLDNPVKYTLSNYNSTMSLPHSKYISLLNFRDNGLYIQTPIYMYKQYFDYYLDEKTILKFDRDDLFFYSAHKILRREGYLYYNDYGSQYKLLSRYGIKPFAVYGRDYTMANGDKNDLRYSNIIILSHYTGVLVEHSDGKTCYKAVLHVNGNIIIGRYTNEEDAAIAYNKAVDTLHANGFSTNYATNYILNLKKEEYLERYSSIKISNSIKTLKP